MEENHKLYTDLALVYHEMYLTIFDYKKGYERIKEYVLQHSSKKEGISICEIGCGSGNLAPRFMKDELFEKYCGVDISDKMIKLANEFHPKGRFVVADMRKIDESFKDEKFDVVAVTGRTFTYMTTNNDVLSALGSISKILNKGGILIFDNFDAKGIFLNFQKSFNNTYKYKEKTFIRESSTKMYFHTGFTWKWKSKYTIKIPGKEDEIIHDNTILRAFTDQELEIFLQLKNLKIIKKYQEEESNFFLVCGSLKE